MENKIKKLGFVVNHLSINQISYELISSANKMLSHRDDVDVSIFWSSDGPRVVKPNFACYCLYEVFGFTGHTVATSLQTASRILSYPGPNQHKMYYYMMDLDWLRLPNKQFEQLRDVYLSPKLNLIARSQDHFNIISSVWKKPLGIVEDANVEGFAELIK